MDAMHDLNCWNAFDGCARFIIEYDARIRRLCSKASALLGSDCGLSSQDGKLCLQRLPLTERRLSSKIDDDTTGLLFQRDNMTMLARYTRCFDGTQPLLALVIRVVSPSEKPRFICLAEAFQLTPAEESVAKMLLAGSSPAQIAREGRLSINTVRSHIAHIHAKVGVSNREALWVKCAPFAVNG